MQRVVVITREIIFLNGPALQPFKLLLGLGSSFFSDIRHSDFFGFMISSAPTCGGGFHFAIELHYVNNLFHSSFLELILDLDGFGLMSLVLNFGSSRLISFR